MSDGSLRMALIQNIVHSLSSVPKQSRGFPLFLASLALVLGGTIYIFLRTSEFVFFKWIKSIGFGNWLERARTHDLSGSSHLPAWIIFSLPSGLWAFAYTVIIIAIWSNNKSKIRYVWMTTIPILVFGFEVLQYLGILPGTFSPQDLLLGMIGIILGIFFVNNTFKQPTHEKATNK
jgi:hypothetical protein